MPELVSWTQEEDKRCVVKADLPQLGNPPVTELHLTPKTMREPS